MVIHNLHTRIGLILETFNALRKETDDGVISRAFRANARLPKTRVGFVGFARNLGKVGNTINGEEIKGVHISRHRDFSFLRVS
jgi:hypothetical protein